MGSYSLHNANFEMLLVIASRSISDLAIQLSQQAGEEVGPLPTKEQFDRAWKANQEQAGWLQEAMEDYFQRSGGMREGPAAPE